MGELIKDAAKASWRFITNRLLWLFVVTALLFYVLLARLFELQIVQIHTFTAPPPITSFVEQPIPAVRGHIYDRFGRPLAVNHPIWVVTIDPTVAISNEALLELTRLFERNNEDFVNDFPMTTEWPYEFTLGGSTPEIRERREFRWKDDMAVPSPETASAAEAFLHLWKWFRLDPKMSNEDARSILNFRCMIFERRFRPQPFVIATDISMPTLAAISEQNAIFTGIEIEIRTQRVYPQGIYFSHMLGYTGLINADELASNPDYAHDDVIGKTGLERSMEAHLRGQRGTRFVEISPFTGRRAGTAPEITPPMHGNDIYLTLDASMQIRTYYILKEYLTEIAIRRIQGGGVAREQRVTEQQIFNNLIRAGWIPIRDIWEADENSAAYALRQYVLDRFREATALRQNRNRIVRILTEGIDSGRITPVMMFSAMVDLGIFSDHNDFLERADSAPAMSLIIEKLRMWELTPQMVNVDPATGSVVVVDVQTGAVLAAVSYPSYDNNRLANRVDADYFFRINEYDPTHPMINRPFMEARAPGSTFKMITAVAGLETGVITPASTINSRGSFTQAGTPHARNNTSGRGNINVIQAIGISDNYFFYETAFRLGSDRLQRISTLNRYMAFFGLNERTGVEIGEFADTFNRDSTQHIMASPAFKAFVHLSRNEFSPRREWDWFDGDTIRTAIGQSYNNYTAAMMARYIMLIANNGVRLPLHLVSSIQTNQGEMIYRTVPVANNTDTTVAGGTWAAIQQGMLQATEGWGTATSHFRGFPVQVAGKTGTAEQIGARLSHTSFGGYAPFEDPQIAIYVTIPFGATGVMPSAATQVALDVIRAFLLPEIVIERPAPINTVTP